MSDAGHFKPIAMACPECDLLNQVPTLAPGESAACARCGATLCRNPSDSLQRALALALTAVILFAVANTFPFLSFGKSGVVTHATLVTGVVGLWAEKMYLVSGAVFLTSVLAPALMLLGVLYLVIPLQYRCRPPAAHLVLRGLTQFLKWNMVEIFMVSVLVSAVKLIKLAAIIPGIAAWSFMALVFVLAAIYASLEPRLLWEKLESYR